MNKFGVLLCLAVVAASAYGEPKAEGRQGRAWGHKIGAYGRLNRAQRGHPLPIRRGYAHPAPPPPPPPPKAYHATETVCDIVHDIATTQECKVVQEKECTTVHETKIRVEYHEQCHTHKEKVCKPTVRKVPDKVCETTYAEECVNEAHTVLETGYVDECKDIKTQVCEESAVVGVSRSPPVVAEVRAGPPVVTGPVVAHPVPHPAPVHPGPKPSVGEVVAPAPVAKVVPAHPAPPPRSATVGATPWKVPAAWRKPHHGRKKREAKRQGKAYGDYSAGPHCHAKVERVCKKVPVQNERVVQHPKCTKVPHTHCRDIVRTVPDKVCHDVPKTHCDKVAEKIPYDVPVPVCKDVDVPVCRDVTQKVPRKVCKQVHHKVYPGHGPYHH